MNEKGYPPTGSSVPGVPGPTNPFGIAICLSDWLLPAPEPNTRWLMPAYACLPDHVGPVKPACQRFMLLDVLFFLLENFRFGLLYVIAYILLLVFGI